MTCEKVSALQYLQGKFFYWSHPKIMELVPPNSEKYQSSQNVAKIPSKKVKVQVNACKTLIFSAKLQQKGKV